jgi:excisionase family DNA binding protein
MHPQPVDLIRRTIRAVDPRSVDGNAVPRLALTKAEAASSLGVSVDFFERHVMPELRIVRCGRRRLIPLAELQRWLQGEARRTLDR